MNLKVDGFRLCIAFWKFLCSPIELLLSLQIPCWYIFHEKQENLTKYIPLSSSIAQSHIYLLLFLIVSHWVITPWNLDGCSSAKSRCLQEGTPGWTQPIGCWRHSLGVTAWGFQSSFPQKCLMVCVARALNVCLPPASLLFSSTQHLCLLLNYNSRQVAGARQLMTECYLWFLSSDRETPLMCISDAGKGCQRLCLFLNKDNFV